MATLTIEVPETLLLELEQRHISNELLHLFIVRTLESLAEAEPEVSAEKIERWLERGESSPFAKSAIPFIEQLLDENQTLFERLTLP